MIYFIQAVQGGLIKIGHADKLEKRFRGIQLMCPIPLQVLSTMEGSVYTEKDLHLYFGQFRVYGEWFEPSQELLDFIKKPHPIEKPIKGRVYSDNPSKIRYLDRCKAMSNNGEACQCYPIENSHYCRHHQLVKQEVAR